MTTWVVIAPAVHRELSGRDLPAGVSVGLLQDAVSARILHASLGAGESATIALALQVEADVVLLDDKAARRLAATLSLHVMGTLGVLLRAKRRGLIPELKSLLDSLRSLPFHIAPGLYEAVLRDADE